MAGQGLLKEEDTDVFTLVEERRVSPGEVMPAEEEEEEQESAMASAAQQREQEMQVNFLSAFPFICNHFYYSHSYPRPVFCYKFA